MNSTADTTRVKDQRTRPFTVMVVDDDELMGEYVAFELQQLGCRSTVVTSGEQAIATLDRDTSFVITDRSMPGMDGIELIRKLREAQGASTHLRIAMMTARADEDVIREAMRAGADDFLFKPIDTIQLELAITSARRTAELHRRLDRRNRLLSNAHAEIRNSLRRVRSDIAAAAGLHRRLLPRRDRLPDLDFALLYHPAETIGGDTIGAMSVGAGKSLFFIFDVVGHGIPSALDSFHLHHRLKQLAPSTPQQLVAAVGRLNSEILERDDDSYATLVCGLIDAPAKKAWVIGAGHPPPLALRPEGVSTIAMDPTHPLGWFADAQYGPTCLDLSDGTALVFFSDGLTDAVVDEPSCADDAGLERLFREFHDLSLDQIRDAVEHKLRKRSEANTPEDDISLLIVRPTQKQEN